MPQRVVMILLLLCLGACSAAHPNRDVLGEQFPSIRGQALSGEEVAIPEDFAGKPVLLLLGFKQDSQFDIDRWLIGLDMTGTQVTAYELPTIAGMAPRMFSTLIDSGMRKGIPRALWGGVITVYADGDRLQQFTGNEEGLSSRVILLNDSGRVVFFHDQGFSVGALNGLREVLAGLVPVRPGIAIDD